TWDFGIASNNNFFWYIANSNSNFKIKYAASSGTDQWEHIVGVFNGTHTSVFVDGEQITTELFGWDSLQTSDTSLHIGKLRNQLDYFNGIIDDVRIYDRVLTAQEIQALYIAYH
ncbi:MAG: LamG domain-containing protein, partial [Candidatus Altiarchaeota archaeon]|nr:LamG domain-containing protein [Candidatus Altiarchaeota archaeon]